MRNRTFSLFSALFFLAFGAAACAQSWDQSALVHQSAADLDADGHDPRQSVYDLLYRPAPIFGGRGIDLFS
jgi:hypothetical protein